MLAKKFARHLFQVGMATMSLASATLAEEPVPFSDLKLPADARANVHPSQLGAAIRGLQQPGKGKLSANPEKTRGPAAEVYSKVAPATVVVRNSRGHGTGFVIDPAGWIVTNHHVIEQCGIDPATGALRAMVNFGRWNADENRMELLEKGVPAVVYQASEAIDLALLKLTDLPEGMQELPVLKLADKSPSPGTDCVAIGHPAAGMLWTVRSGEVSGVGRWPREMIDVVMARLSSTNDDRKRLEQQIAAVPPRKVLLSSCGVNPGDSGGPLVNSKGELIAVTFAIPKGGTDQGISLDKFAYHIHLDELNVFLAKRPDQPAVVVPNPWPIAVYVKDRDLNGNKTTDTLMFGLEQDQKMTGFLVDVDEDSGRRFTAEQLASAAKNKTWDFEFAYQLVPHLRAFYDTDNDGQLDLILTDADRDGKVEAALQFKENAWQPVAPPSQKLINPSLLSDTELRGRFEKILEGLQGGKK